MTRVVAPRGQTARDRDRLLTALRLEQPAYSGVGSTASVPLVAPNGFRSATVRRTVGTGRDAFETAKHTLAAWRMHEHAGVLPINRPAIAIGETVLAVLPFAAVEVRFACRIVDVVDEKDRFGFSYGTLSLHPESGEERFVVAHHLDGSVTFTISVFWRPASTFARLGGPVSRLLQARFTDRYLDAVTALAGQSTPTARPMP